MFAINSTQNSDQKVSPNILPCKINYSGPVNATKRLWNVESDDKDQKIAYFRGRKLIGKDILLPSGYKGVVVQKTDRTIPQIAKRQPMMDDDDMYAGEDEQGQLPQEIKIMEETATFDKITVWGHEAEPVDVEDVYVKGINEWMQFAHAMHSYDDQTEEAK